MATRSGEDQLVGRVLGGFRDLPRRGLRLGPGDDAALWQPRAGHATILTSDWFLEGSHFLREKHPADSVGWKCLARATSDIAAMGGRPRCFLLNLAIPPSLTGKWLAEFLGGLGRAARSLRCSMAGGDTTSNERILVNVTVLGEVLKGRAVLRSGAGPDDLLFVTGALGEAEWGLRKLPQAKDKRRATDPALCKHLYPEPRITLAGWLVKNRLATAMMDISDGLSTDLARLCESSGVGAVVSEGALPGPEGLPPGEATRLALDGGDDYELLFAVKPDRVPKLPKSYQGVPITCVGVTSKTRKLLLRKKDGRTRELLPGGWDPFRN